MTLNEYNYLQSRFSRKLKKPDYTSKNAGYNAGISECRSIIFIGREDPVVAMLRLG